MKLQTQVNISICILIAWLGSFWLEAFLWQVLESWTRFPLVITGLVLTMIAMFSVIGVLNSGEENKS